MTRQIWVGLLGLIVSFGVAAGNSKDASTELTVNESRGKLLYEQHCQACHSPGVHQRARRKVDSHADLSFQISRWQTELDLRWGPSEMADVAAYLRRRYYEELGPLVQ